MIACRTLGPVAVLVNDAAPPADLLWRKNLALLVYLARSPRRRRTRDHLAALLWGEKPERAARQSLREAIRVLRRAAGEDGIVTEHDQVHLADGVVRLDVEQFDAAAGRGDWETACALAAGEFLEGFVVPDASPFEDWLAAERAHWRGRMVEALAAWAEVLLGRGRLREGADAARRALALDPVADRAARAAMTALALTGDRAGALAVYDRLAARLAETGGVPDAETAALAERVRRERTWRLVESVPAAVSAAGAESRRAPLVGRGRELETLLGAWRRVVEDRRAGMAVVAADAGLGKTRLLEELAARARLAGATVATLRAVEADRAEAWSGVTGLARGGLLDAPGLAAASPSALVVFTTIIPEWAERFPTLASHVSPVSPGSALTDILRAATPEQPVLLLADDAHWLDRESLLALQAVLRDLAGAPLCVVLGIAPQPPRDELDHLRTRLGRDVPGVAVTLRPLDEAALRALARWALPAYGDAELERLVRRLLVDSAGLPLLAVELLHAVALGLDLGTVAGAWPAPFKTLDQTLPGELPDAVVAAIRVGVRRLSADAQAVLAAAAVLDEPVTPERVARATRIADGRLAAALDELEWQRWLAADARGYAFVARIVREVVARDMVTEGQRRRLTSPRNS